MPSPKTGQPENFYSTRDPFNKTRELIPFATQSLFICDPAEAASSVTIQHSRPAK